MSKSSSGNKKLSFRGRIKRNLFSGLKFLTISVYEKTTLWYNYNKLISNNIIWEAAYEDIYKNTECFICLSDLCLRLYQESANNQRYDLLR